MPSWKDSGRSMGRIASLPSPSGAKTYRGQLRRALDQCEAGDVLMVTRLEHG
jgi:DNA invertase Pin-like site-specific DNA recombinase